ncbi:MAG: septum formation protein Maf [Ruminococcaceae bacterium]|nr:septum formation protein Maf [Oscillospiraceae bacterium]
MNIILASASPRRRELIKLITNDALCISADIDESLPDGIEGESSPEFLACQKALFIAKDHPDSLVIGCDTAVFIDGLMLNKPNDENDAFNMLRLLSGRTHKVITGCCLVKGKKTMSFSCTSNVKFFDLSEEQILNYIATGEPMDKAGAYGIQEKGSLLVEKIDGDYFNIVGLPVSMLNLQIKNFKENF